MCDCHRTIKLLRINNTRGSVGWACVAHLSFCCEEILHRTFHIGASYQISIHVATRFQRRRFFRNNQKQEFLMYQNEMCKIYRRSSIDASYQLSIHLTMWFQRRRLLKINQSETRIACDGHVCKRIMMKCTICIEDLQ
jgi:adenine C2-methylase RlmN of 23S rRNA A2503 and tRNA A37